MVCSQLSRDNNIIKPFSRRSGAAAAAATLLLLHPCATDASECLHSMAMNKGTFSTAAVFPSQGSVPTAVMHHHRPRLPTIEEETAEDATDETSSSSKMRRALKYKLGGEGSKSQGQGCNGATNKDRKKDKSQTYKTVDEQGAALQPAMPFSVPVLRNAFGSSPPSSSSGFLTKLGKRALYTIDGATGEKRELPSLSFDSSIGEKSYPSQSRVSKKVIYHVKSPVESKTERAYSEAMSSTPPHSVLQAPHWSFAFPSRPAPAPATAPTNPSSTDSPAKMWPAKEVLFHRFVERQNLETLAKRLLAWAESRAKIREDLSRPYLQHTPPLKKMKPSTDAVLEHEGEAGIAPDSVKEEIETYEEEEKEYELEKGVQKNVSPKTLAGMNSSPVQSMPAPLAASRTPPNAVESTIHLMRDFPWQDLEAWWRTKYGDKTLKAGKRPVADRRNE